MVCCMTLGSGLLHDTDNWTVARHWYLVYCMTKQLDCFMRLTWRLLHGYPFWIVTTTQTFGMLHGTDLRTAAWHFCMTLTSGLLCDTDHCTFAWQWHLNSCITRISVQLHDPDRWTIAWQWHLVCCMTLTFWLSRDTARPSHDTDRWTVAWRWFLDYIYMTL